jgi:hypothetical protein
MLSSILGTMRKRMEQVTVYTKDGQIWLEASEERDALIIDPAQVPTLIEWLREATAELLGAKKDGEP